MPIENSPTDRYIITLTVACTQHVSDGAMLLEALRRPTGKPDEMVWHLLEKYLLLVRLGRNSKGARKRARMAEFGIPEHAEIHPHLRLVLDIPMGYTPYEAMVMSRTKAIFDAARAATEHQVFLNAFCGQECALQGANAQIAAEARALAALLNP